MLKMSSAQNMEMSYCAGGIVFNQDREVLVIRNQIGKNTFPKGRIEAGESLSQAALREIREESGLTRVRIVRYLGLLSRLGYTAENSQTPSLRKQIEMFYCVTNEEKLQPEALDSVYANWVKLDQLQDTLSWQEEYDFFKANEANMNPCEAGLQRCADS